jgi:hypothetical protein
MPLFERHQTLFERTLTLLGGQANGPLLLRIGGDSADHAILDPNVTRAPSGVFALTPEWFGNTSVMVRHVGARTILDLNLVTDLPRMAAQWARAAEAQMPPGSITGYEIGNEPDLYNPSYWSAVFSPIKHVLGIRLSSGELLPGTYVRLYDAYAQELAQVAPGMRLLAPVVAYPAQHVNWIATLLDGRHPGLRTVTGHEYPYSACAAPGSPDYPTIAKLLSENATGGIAAALRPAIRLAHQAGFPFHLTELNSVTCGGVPGISNTFATALWAPDALFELLRAGVDGVNVHVRAYAINAAFAVTGHGVVARPLLYGLILFTRTLGPDPVVINARVETRPAGALKVWVVRVRGGVLHVLLINKGTRPARADLQLPATGNATVERLQAPSAAARSGVTLDGQHLGPYDTWVGQPDNHRVTPGPRGYELTVPPTSAALVIVPGRTRAARAHT